MVSLDFTVFASSVFRFCCVRQQCFFGLCCVRQQCWRIQHYPQTLLVSYTYDMEHCWRTQYYLQTLFADISVTANSVGKYKIICRHFCFDIFMV